MPGAVSGSLPRCAIPAVVRELPARSSLAQSVTLDGFLYEGWASSVPMEPGAYTVSFALTSEIATDPVTHRTLLATAVVEWPPVVDSEPAR